jgi:hypothetical protein
MRSAIRGLNFEGKMRSAAIQAESPMREYWDRSHVTRQRSRLCCGFSGFSVEVFRPLRERDL